MEGYEVTTVDDAISRCNIVVTTTGESTFPSGSRVADGVTRVGFELRTL
jgi:S-adenosylhomocysteine hydrolase